MPRTREKMNKVTKEDLVRIEKVANEHRNFYQKIIRNISKIRTDSRVYIVDAISAIVYYFNDSLNSDLKHLLTELENFFGNDADSYIDRLQKQKKGARNFIINTYANFVFNFGLDLENFFFKDFTEYYQREEFDVNEINSILEDARLEKLPLKD